MDQINKLKKLISLELKHCSAGNTPYVCNEKSTPEGYQKIEQLIINLIDNNGLTISQAIIEIERTYNPNIGILDDGGY